MGLEKLEILAYDLLDIAEWYDPYDFQDSITYDDMDDEVANMMDQILNNSYSLLNRLEDMYYDVEDYDPELADKILTVMDDITDYSNYTPTQRAYENKLLEVYLNKKEITMENKFEGIIRGKELKEDLDFMTDDELYKENLEILDEYEKRTNKLLSEIKQAKSLCEENKLDQSYLNNELTNGFYYYDAPKYPLSIIDSICSAMLKAKTSALHNKEEK